MRSIAVALSIGALCAVAADSTAAPERPGDAAQAGVALDRSAAARTGESAAVAALLDTVDRELAAERPAQALALLERALRIEPRNAALWHYLGLANLALGNHAQAEAMAAKSHSLAAGNRTLRTRNARLTTAALRAQGKPVLSAGRDAPRWESGGPLDAQIEPAAAYAGARDVYERPNRAEQRRRTLSMASPSQSRARAGAEAPQTRESGIERARRERAVPRGECWISAPNQRARRLPPTIRCDALNGQDRRSSASSSVTPRSAPRAERRSYRRDGWNGYAL
jgi:tetratricopeptide (TPR) repeat protein